MMNRRTFLKATVAAASGLILPDWLLRAENYIERESRPYLEKPQQADTILYAVDWGGDEYQFELGDPYQGPPTMTWREFLDWKGYDSFEDYYGSDDPNDFPAHSLDDEVDDWIVLDHWVYDGSPSAEAFKYLECLDLGPDFGSANGVGEIKFYDGVCPGNDSRLVTAPDDLSISLLQKRLNDLGEGVIIKMEIPVAKTT
jgi:hypothetical protein